MNIEEILKPDQYNLDKEWVNQPEYMLHYLDEMAQARILMDAAKEFIDETKAQLDGNIRRNPQEYGLEKLTETLVANTVTLQKEYKYAVQQLADAKEEYYRASNIVQALEHRKAALENLVKLFSLGYFAQPTEPDMDLQVTRAKANENVKRKRGRPRKEE